MKLATWQIDFRSLLIGVALAVGAIWLFSGTSSQAQQPAKPELHVGDGGVYILRSNGSTVWRSRDLCARGCS